MAIGNVILTGTIRIPLAEQPRLLPLLQQHILLTRAEPGCLTFSVEPSADDPSTFTVSECFRDETAFAYHQARGAASAWGIAAKHLQRQFTKTLG